VCSLREALGVSHSARASIHCYTTRADVDAFITHLGTTLDFFDGAADGAAGGGDAFVL